MSPLSDPPAVTYRAFLSYSHRDAASATYWHGRLQEFTIGRPFANMPTRFGPVPHRLTPIFRDRLHFPPGHELIQATQRALDQSAALIILCSPDSAVSDYVNAEALYFRHTHQDRPIILVLIGPDGTPFRAMLPRALAFALDEAGATTTTEWTPLAVDPRPSGDGEVLATAKIIGRILNLDEHWLGEFVEHAVELDLSSRHTADRAEERHRELMTAINRDKGVPLAALRSILSEFGYQEALDDPDRARAVLATKAAEFIALTEQLNRLTNHDPAVHQLRQQAAAELAAGRFDMADELQARAEKSDLDVATELEVTAVRRRLSAAVTRAGRGDTARLKLDYRGAANHYAEAASIIPVEETSARWVCIMAQASALCALGREFGDNRALENAIDAYSNALKLVPLEREPDKWATNQNELGVALETLGARENNPARVNLAIISFRAALEHRTRERAPLLWGETMTSLGLTLSTLSRQKTNVERLKEAIVTLRSALEECTHANSPQLWATIHNNLGGALRNIGTSESNSNRLEEAVASYEAALIVWTHEQNPLLWATVQSNLGTALATLGELKDNSELLIRAIDAFRAALLVRTRERVPLDWATTQNNLGSTLVALGQGETGTERLEQAITTYREALKERTRERVPMYWAMTQRNLGKALALLGTRESDTARLTCAVAAFRAALGEYTRERAPLDWATTQNNLANALRTLGECLIRAQASDTTSKLRLDEAVVAFRAALQEQHRDRFPLVWAFSQHGLANTLVLLAVLTRDRMLLAEALARMRDAADTYREGGNGQWLPKAEQRIALLEATLTAWPLA